MWEICPLLSHLLFKGLGKWLLDRSMDPQDPLWNILYQDIYHLACICSHYDTFQVLESAKILYIKPSSYLDILLWLVST
jgi:hypothetical protein